MARGFTLQFTCTNVVCTTNGACVSILEPRCPKMQPSQRNTTIHIPSLSHQNLGPCTRVMQCLESLIMNRVRNFDSLCTNNQKHHFDLLALKRSHSYLIVFSLCKMYVQVRTTFRLKNWCRIFFRGGYV